MSLLKDVLRLKRQMDEAGISMEHVLFCPAIPMLGIEKEYVIEEIHGVRVARLISPPED